MPSIPLAQTGPRDRLLQQLAKSAVLPEYSQLPCISERLGRLFGLGDTMNLDAATAYRTRQPGEVQGAMADRLTDELATTRQALVRRIQAWADELEFEGEPEFETVQDACLALRRRITANSRQLRDKVRKAMKTQGQTLARLAELDSVFDHTMTGYTSQCFSQLSRVLEQRFQALQTSSEQLQASDQQTGHWFHRYCEETQIMLLAELDVRLEPVLGLLEACHNEVNKTL
ncbi:DUF3348 family protein [Marinobacter sp. F3R11]|uniref:DUF3348 family protein n=1 Tax=Marinobacter sp. F3R11 TaxID=2267231 RepID=UPI000DE9015F|nr:DUF3348 family protein [Marinobacter sp. F3R11]RBW48630.1 DUF3348 domain-containing protein [Marinobacter sp. F3R11]